MELEEQEDVPGAPGPPPSERLGPVPWGVGEGLLVLVGAYLCAWIWTALRAVLAERGLVSADALSQWSLPVGFVAMGLPAVLWLGFRHRDGLRRLFGRLERPLRTVGLGLALGAGVFVVTRLALALLLLVAGGGELPELPQVQEEFRDLAQDPLLAGWFMFTVVLVAPAVEEILFRGIIFQAARDVLGVWPGIGLSSLLFTVLHLNPASPREANLLVFVMVFPLAMFLAWIFQRLGSLAVPIAVHASYNLIGVLIFRLAG